MPSYHDRVKAIYEKYEPAKVGQVDATLAKYVGKEEQVIAALVKKYGPEPAADAAAPTPATPPAAAKPVATGGGGSAPASPRSYKERVVALYEKYEPSKVSQADATLAKYVGKEEQVIAALVKKYGPEPDAAPAGAAPPPAAGSPAKAVPTLPLPQTPRTDSAGPTPRSHKERVHAIFAKYDPTKTGQTDAQLAKFAGKEEQLINALVKKYGPEPDAAGGSQPVPATPRSDAPSASTPRDEGPTPATPRTPAAGGGSGSYHDRVAAIFQKYDPGKAGQTTAQLEKFKGQEEKLIAALVKKYGPEPTAESSPAATSAPAAAASPGAATAPSGTPPVTPRHAGMSHRDRAIAIYKKYDPSKVGQVDATLAKYPGKEEQVIASLVKKYGPEPDPEPAAAAATTAASPAHTEAPAVATAAASPPAKRTYKERVIALYEKYEPSKVGQADATLSKYVGKEEQVIAALVKKYGPEPEPTTAAAPAPVEPAAPAAATAPAAPAKKKLTYKERVVALYEKYEPSKVSQADATLAKYVGKEEQVIAALVKKYGPEPDHAPAADATPSPPASVPRVRFELLPAKTDSPAVTPRSEGGDLTPRDEAPVAPAAVSSDPPSSQLTPRDEAPASQHDVVSPPASSKAAHDPPPDHHKEPAAVKTAAAAPQVDQKELLAAQKRIRALEAKRGRAVKAAIIGLKEKWERPLLRSYFAAWGLFGEKSVAKKAASARGASTDEVQTVADAILQHRRSCRAIGLRTDIASRLAKISGVTQLDRGAFDASTVAAACDAVENRYREGDAKLAQATATIVEIKALRDKAQADKEHAYARILHLASQASIANRDLQDREKKILDRDDEITKLKKLIVEHEVVINAAAGRYAALEKELVAERCGMPSGIEAALEEKDQSVARLHQLVAKTRTSLNESRAREDALKAEITRLSETIDRYRRRALSGSAIAASPSGGGFANKRAAVSPDSGLRRSVSPGRVAAPLATPAVVDSPYYTVRADQQWSPPPAYAAAALRSVSETKSGAAAFDDDLVLGPNSDFAPDETSGVDGALSSPERALKAQSQWCGSCPHCDVPLTAVGDKPPSAGRSKSPSRGTPSSANSAPTRVAFCFSCRSSFSEKDLRQRDVEAHNRRFVRQRFGPTPL